MRFVSGIFLVVLLVLSTFSTAFAATIGTVVPVTGAVADLVHDPVRNLVYLANYNRNEVDIYNVAQRRVTGSIYTGLQPSSLAMSPDGNTLYVANSGSNTVSVVSLISQQDTNDYFLSGRPDAVAVGNDGKVVMMVGGTGLQRLDPLTGVVSTVPITPPPTPAAGITIPNSQTPTSLFAGLITTASGNLIIGLSTNRLFVYEVSSGSVLRSRNVTGLRAIMSASTDGSRFMAGPFLFDTQTLTILGRAAIANATMNGGSAFSLDGNSVYGYFSTQTLANPINPLNTNQPPANTIPGVAGTQTGTLAVLQVLRSSSLTPQLGLRMPEVILSKIIASADGDNLFANSTSGIMVIPIGQLSTLPILDVSTPNVVLSIDPCNRTVATASIQIRNLGTGRLTFSATVNNQTAANPVVLNQRTGVAPANLTISLDARNLTTFNALQYSIILVSPEAVNVEPAILVNVNYRDVTQRGAVVPMSGVAVDMQMDAPRQRLYIANYTQDQIEVFSLATQTFLSPIRVGNRPLSMTMPDPNTLIVANSGSENLSIVDLNTLQEVDEIVMGPIPLGVTAPLFPHSVASSSNAILFTAVPLSATPGLAPGGSGSVWQLSRLTRAAFPRTNLGIGATGTLSANTINVRNLLVAPADGSSVALVEANGTMRLYDPVADTFVVTRTAAQTQLPALRGAATAAADGSYFVIDNNVYNSSLVYQSVLGGIAGGIIPPGGVNPNAALGVVTTGNNLVRVQGGTAAAPVQSLQRLSLTTLQANLQVSMAEPIMDINLQGATAIGAGTRLWPPRPTALELGLNNNTVLLQRGMLTDAGGNNTYLLTYSGLSVVSLAVSTGRTPIFAANGVVSSVNRTNRVSPGSLISILGTNLADPDSASSTPLPKSLGGVCITANEIAIPLLTTSSNQIDAQLPPELTTGRVTLTIRSTRLGISSAGVPVAVTSTSPAIFSMDVDGQSRAVLFHDVDGTLVLPAYPADADESLTLYATGLGPVNPVVPAGELNPQDPPSRTNQPVTVTIGGESYPVTWAGLAPGFVGVYQIKLLVPGNRIRGDDLPVVVTAGGLSSASTNAPLAAIE